MRALSSICALVLCLAGIATPGAQAPAPATVIVVRHAEAVPDAGRDPALTETGQARARALAEALKDAGLSAVYATQYQRTRLTGTPAAEAAGLQVSVREIRGETDAYVDALVKEVLASHSGRTVLIVGHSNTVPAIVRGFSGVDAGEIAHDSYDTLFVVTTASAGKGSVVRARYGV